MKMRPLKNTWLPGVLAALLMGCSLAPKYEIPPMPIPDHYKETEHWKPAKKPDTTMHVGPWWQLFGDPVLNDLEEKVTLANQNLKIAYAQYQQARAAVQVARSALYPSIVGISNGDRQQTSRRVANVNNKTLFNDFLIGEDLSYEVDLWGRIHNSVVSSESSANASAADLASVFLSLHADLATYYITLRSDEAAQRVLDKTVIAYEKALYLTRKRHDGGAAPIADVDQAQTQLENARTLATDMRLQRAQLEHAIAILIGEIPANFSLPRAQARLKFMSIAPNLPSTLLERRPDIVAAEQRVKAANADIGVACAAFFPSINLVSIVAFQSKTLHNLLTKPALFWSLGPANSLNILQPLVTEVIFDGGKLRGLLNLAKANYHQTVASYRQTVLTAFQEVEDNLVAIRRLDQENQSQTAATLAAIRALKQANYRYAGGIITFLEVVVVENIALQAELASIDIRLRRQIASVQLIKALGGGWSPRYYKKQLLT